MDMAHICANTTDAYEIVLSEAWVTGPSQIKISAMFTELTAIFVKYISFA